MSPLRTVGTGQVVALVESWSDAGWPLLEPGLLARAEELGWQSLAPGYFTTGLPWSKEGIADVATVFTAFSSAFAGRWGAPVYDQRGPLPVRVWRLPTGCGVSLNGNRQGVRVHVYSPAYLEAWLAAPEDEESADDLRR